ncbi:hypothetical protein RSAG8_08034, partial [Rhizoctonia solani AG-8 WAC10335]
MTKSEVDPIFKGQDLKGMLAIKWAEHLKEGHTDEEVGKNHKKFYQKAIAQAREHISKLSNDSIDRSKFPDKEELGAIFSKLFASATQMLDCVAPKCSGTTNTCYFYFDEAHNLTKAPRIIEGVHSWSSYHNLGKKFAPVAHDYPSNCASDRHFLIPPFTELPFDIFVPDVYKTLDNSKKTQSLHNACTTEVMSSMGQPLWFIHYQRWQAQQHPSPASGKVRKVEDIMMFANDKLTAQASQECLPESELAALSICIGITFDSTTPASCQAESQQVDSHMHIVYAIPEHQEYMRSGCSSEPILAEAAARFLHYTDNKAGVAVSGPRILAENMKRGFLAKDAYPNTIPVLAFLRALFAENHQNLILNGTPVTGEDGGPRLETTFKEAFVCFSHFALTKDSKMLEAKCLQVALLRGMAMQAKDNQYSIDAVIPIHMGPITRPITTETTSTINLQFKNRLVSSSCTIDQKITVPDLKQPVISIVFELGEKLPKAPLVQLYHATPPVTRGRLSGSNPDPDSDPQEAKNYYKTILAASGLRDDFPQVNIPKPCIRKNCRALWREYDSSDQVVLMTPDSCITQRFTPVMLIGHS